MPRTWRDLTWLGADPDDPGLAYLSAPAGKSQAERRRLAYLLRLRDGQPLGCPCLALGPCWHLTAARTAYVYHHLRDTWAALSTTQYLRLRATWQRRRPPIERAIEQGAPDFLGRHAGHWAAFFAALDHEAEARRLAVEDITAAWGPAIGTALATALDAATPNPQGGIGWSRELPPPPSPPPSAPPPATAPPSAAATADSSPPPTPSASAATVSASATGSITANSPSGTAPATKATRGDIVIVTHPPDGPSLPVAVSAWLVGGTLACHLSLFGQTGWARWTVTHVPTSMALGWFTTLNRAKAYCGALHQALPHLGEWTTLAAVTPADQATINDLYTAHATGELDARTAIRSLRQPEATHRALEEHP